MFWLVTTLVLLIVHAILVVVSNHYMNKRIETLELKIIDLENKIIEIKTKD